MLNVSARAENLTRGEADIAIRLFRATESDLVVRKLGAMPMGLHDCRSYLAAHGEPMKAADLSQHRIISYRDALGTKEENQWLLEHIAPTSPILQTDSTASRLKATIEGLRISIQPCLIAAAHPSLSRVLPDITLPGHELWMAYHRDLRNVLRVAATGNFLAGIFTDSKVANSS